MPVKSSLSHRQGSLRHRIERLEADHATRQSTAGQPTGRVLLMAALLAFRCGNLQDGEAPIEAYARALRFSSARDLRAAMQGDCDLWRQRHAERWLDLLADEAIEPADLSLDDVRLLAEKLLPVKLMSRLGLTGSVHA